MSTPVTTPANVNNRRNNQKKKPSQPRMNQQPDLAGILTTLVGQLQANGGNSPDIAMQLANLVKQQVIPMISTISAVDLERARSVVIAGIPEKGVYMLERQNYDRATLYGLCDELGVEAVPVMTYRLGQKLDGKHRLMKVVLASRKMQRALITAAPNLRKSSNAKFKDVYIRPSLTPEQLEKQRELVTELLERRKNGENVKISKMQIVPGNPKN